jgi:hypothetical protein
MLAGGGLLERSPGPGAAVLHLHTNGQHTKRDVREICTHQLHRAYANHILCIKVMDKLYMLGFGCSMNEGRRLWIWLMMMGKGGNAPFALAVARKVVEAALGAVPIPKAGVHPPARALLTGAPPGGALHGRPRARRARALAPTRRCQTTA